MASYDEYCPIAVVVEFFGDRWIPAGPARAGGRFSPLQRDHRGIPRVSRSRLCQRLRVLVSQGLVERHEEGHTVEYHLTEAGADLEPIIWALGHWAARSRVRRPAQGAARRRLASVADAPAC